MRRARRRSGTMRDTVRHRRADIQAGESTMKNSLPRGFALLAAALLLHGCGGSSSAADPANSPSGGASGPPTVDAKGCTAYGDPPRPLAPLSPDGLLNDAISTLANIC